MAVHGSHGVNVYLGWKIRSIVYPLLLSLLVGNTLPSPPLPLQLPRWMQTAFPYLARLPPQCSVRHPGPPPRGPRVGRTSGLTGVGLAVDGPLSRPRPAVRAGLGRGFVGTCNDIGRAFAVLVFVCSHLSLFCPDAAGIVCSGSVGSRPRSASRSGRGKRPVDVGAGSGTPTYVLANTPVTCRVLRPLSSTC